MLRAIIESPLSGDFARNTRYARLCCLDSLQRGEAPYASHLLYTQMLDDRIPEHRKMGMEAGFRWAEAGDLRAFYVDLGFSGGMAQEALAAKLDQRTERRYLPPGLLALLDDNLKATPGAAS